MRNITLGLILVASNMEVWAQNDSVSDYLAVRTILDTNDLDSVPVMDVACWSEGRVVYLDLTRRDTSLCIRGIPAVIGQLSKLRRLDVSGNCLTNIPDSICNLDSLEWLLLSSNRLTQLPDSIGQMTNLGYLYLQWNELTTLPISIARLGQVRGVGVTLCCNRLCSLPPEIVT